MTDAGCETDRRQCSSRRRTWWMIGGGQGERARSCFSWDLSQTRPRPRRRRPCLAGRDGPPTARGRGRRRNGPAGESWSPGGECGRAGIVRGRSGSGAVRCVAASEDDTLLSCHTTPVCMWALDSDPRRFRNIWELCGPRSLVPPFSRLTFGKHEHLWYQITRVPRP